MRRDTSRKTEVSLVRSSAAEYLTFVAASGQGGLEAVYADESIWLTQKMMGALYDVNVRTVNEHLKKIVADSELQEDSVIRKFRITASDGKNYNTQHYSLPAIIAVGYKVNSERAVQFRKWATGIIEQFTIKAYVMDDGPAQYSHDHARLGDAPQSLHRSHRPVRAARRWRSNRRNCEDTRRERIREIPHRARPPV